MFKTGILTYVLRKIIEKDLSDELIIFKNELQKLQLFIGVSVITETN